MLTEVGFFKMGGGIAGDFPICVVPMLYQDMEMPETPFGAISAKFQIQLPVRFVFWSCSE
jgi:hypothetical protein